MILRKFVQIGADWLTLLFKGLINLISRVYRFWNGLLPTLARDALISRYASTSELLGRVLPNFLSGLDCGARLYFGGVGSVVGGKPAGAGLTPLPPLNGVGKFMQKVLDLDKPRCPIGNVNLAPLVGGNVLSVLWDNFGVC